MAAGNRLFNWYEQGCMIEDHEVEKLINYLAGQLIAWSPNRAYYQDWYNEANNLQIVIRWRKRNRGVGCGKKGERVCYKNSPGGQIVNLLTDRDHIKNTGCTCNSLDV